MPSSGDCLLHRDGNGVDVHRDGSMTHAWARNRRDVLAILEAVESNCTVGEIAGALRSVFGEYRETVVI
jgi:methylmalonyl-CoA mutase N-terminal domain/subunit